MHQGATCAAYTYGLLRDLTHQGLAAGSSSAPQGPSSSSSSKAQPEAAELNRRILLELFALDRVLLPGMPVLDDVLGGPADPLVPLQVGPCPVVSDHTWDRALHTSLSRGGACSLRVTTT